jgi:hypothetical protein
MSYPVIDDLNCIADELGNVSSVLKELPDTNVPRHFKKIVYANAISLIDAGRMALLKTALRIQRAEEADRAHLEMED